jgi:hypothetical protein
MKLDERGFEEHGLRRVEIRLVDGFAQHVYSDDELGELSRLRRRRRVGFYGRAPLMLGCPDASISLRKFEWHTPSVAFALWFVYTLTTTTYPISTNPTLGPEPCSVLPTYPAFVLLSTEMPERVRHWIARRHSEMLGKIIVAVRIGCPLARFLTGFGVRDRVRVLAEPAVAG